MKNIYQSSLNNISCGVADACGVPLEVLRKNKSRSDTIRIPRQIFHYIAVEHYGYGLSQVGRFTGHDHATIINSVKVVKNGITPPTEAPKYLVPYLRCKKGMQLGLSNEELQVVFLSDDTGIKSDNIFDRINFFKSREVFYKNLREKYERIRDNSLYGVTVPMGQVIKIDTESGMEVGRYTSAKEAALGMDFSAYSGINRCLNKEAKTCGGYKWKYDYEMLSE